MNHDSPFRSKDLRQHHACNGVQAVIVFLQQCIHWNLSSQPASKKHHHDETTNHNRKKMCILQYLCIYNEIYVLRRRQFSMNYNCLGFASFHPSILNSSSHPLCLFWYSLTRTRRKINEKCGFQMKKCRFQMKKPRLTNVVYYFFSDLM